MARDDQGRLRLQLLGLVDEHAHIIGVRAEVGDLVQRRRGNSAEIRRRSPTRRGSSDRGRRRSGRAGKALGEESVLHNARRAGCYARRISSIRRQDVRQRGYAYRMSSGR